MPRLRDITAETAAVTPSEAQITTAPVITAAPSTFNPADYTMGPDTCGFTTGTTITCTDVGDYCINIGDYRGCCAGTPEECSETIYTTCMEDSDSSDGYMYNTLYCTGALPHCMTHYFTTTAIPGLTYTNVACGTMAVFGQLYPVPPELVTMSDAAPIPINTSTISSVDPEDGTTTNRTVAIGAIVGAIVGAVLLIVLIVIASILIVRRKRLRAQLNDAAAAARFVGGSKARKGSNAADNPDALPAMHDAASAAERRKRDRLLRLSTIPEITGPASPTVARSDSNNLGGVGRFRSTRRSYGPEWPLGSTDPLESHPVPPAPPSSAQQTPDLEKQTGENGKDARAVPALVLPDGPSSLTPTDGRSPATKEHQVSSVSPSKKSLKGGSPISPAIIKVMKQSPRLSYHPASPMDAAFNDEVERRVRRLDGSGPSLNDEVPAAVASASGDNDGGDVSPIDSEDGGHPLDNRMSMISVQSVQRDQPALDDIVSPIAPEEDRTLQEEWTKGDDKLGPSVEDVEENGGNVSPITVSPMESRKSSLATSAHLR